MKFSLMYLTLVSLFYTMNLCEIKIEKTNSLFELGNCTDIGQIINLQSMEEVSGSLSNNLKKYRKIPCPVPPLNDNNFV